MGFKEFLNENSKNIVAHTANAIVYIGTSNEFISLVTYI